MAVMGGTDAGDLYRRFLEDQQLQADQRQAVQPAPQIQQPVAPATAPPSAPQPQPQQWGATPAPQQFPAPHLQYQYGGMGAYGQPKMQGGPSYGGYQGQPNQQQRWDGQPMRRQRGPQQDQPERQQQPQQQPQAAFPEAQPENQRERQAPRRY